MNGRSVREIPGLKLDASTASTSVNAKASATSGNTPSWRVAGKQVLYRNDFRLHAGLMAKRITCCNA